MDVLIGLIALIAIAGGTYCILWLSKYGRARAYRMVAAWARSNADAHDTRVRRRAEYMEEAV
jgi:hypothetical protein